MNSLHFSHSSDSIDSTDSSKDNNDKMKAEWIEQSERLANTQQHVYILTLVSHDHSANWGRGSDIKIIGIFNSKAAAVAKSVTVHTWHHGAFDESLKDMFDGAYVDNRTNPPDNGILWKIGGNDVGEGDYCELQIEKHQIMGLEEKQKTSKVNGNSRKDNIRRPHNKKKRKPSMDIIVID